MKLKTPAGYFDADLILVNREPQYEIEFHCTNPGVEEEEDTGEDDYSILISPNLISNRDDILILEDDEEFDIRHISPEVLMYLDENMIDNENCYSYPHIKWSVDAILNGRNDINSPPDSILKESNQKAEQRHERMKHTINGPTTKYRRSLVEMLLGF